MDGERAEDVQPSDGIFLRSVARLTPRIADALT